MASRIALIVGITAGFCLCGSASAGFYQFTFEGQVTLSTIPEVNVGDPFSLQYVAADTDLDPDPNIGRYTATPAKMHFPGATIMSADGFDRDMRVVLNEPGRDRVSYSDRGFNISTVMTLHFPPGTFGSDALPLSLPLSVATEATFSHLDFTTFIRGNIQSHSVVAVPETSLLGLPLVGLVIGARRRW